MTKGKGHESKEGRPAGRPWSKGRSMNATRWATANSSTISTGWPPA